MTHGAWAELVALHSADRGVNGVDPCSPGEVDAQPCTSDWLPLQQAACELGISPGKARRMIRRGELRNRVVARPGGFAYLVYLPNSWHARFAEHADETATEQPAADEPLVVAGQASWRDRGEAAWSTLAQSIERALHPPATASHLRLVQADGPYARYRRLARKRRWWRF